MLKVFGGAENNKMFRIKKALLATVFFAVLFVLLSSVVIVNALGYKYNPYTRSFTLTGALFVLAKPSKADIYFDGSLVSRNSYFRREKILPGKHYVEVDKNGYNSWERIVRIDPGKTLWLDDVLLFLTNPLLEPTTQKDVERFLSFKDDTALAIEKNELYYYRKGFPKLITRLSEDILSARFFPDKKHVVYQVGDAVYSSDLQGTAINNLYVLESDAPVKMMFVEEGRKLLIKQNDKIVKLKII